MKLIQDMNNNMEQPQPSELAEAKGNCRSECRSNEPSLQQKIASLWRLNDNYDLSKFNYLLQVMLE